MYHPPVTKYYFYKVKVFSTKSGIGMKILYYDCFSGISGDMNLGAMIDLGVEAEWLKGELNKLNLPGWEIKTERDQRHGIFGTKVTVDQTVKEHVHRHMSDIRNIINNSDLSDAVKYTSLKIFSLVAEAEAKVHNTDIEKIHFHEVGAVDSIIDIVGAAICFHKLDISKVMVSTLELGSGFVECAHGTLPVPAPATAEIAKDLIVSAGGVDFEATTPTGAAIVAALGNEFGSKPLFRIGLTGYGIGHRVNPLKPNILRVFMGETDENGIPGQDAMMIECNIDDMNPELYDHLMDRLFEEGASDVFLTPMIMKKSRPATKVSIICSPGLREKMVTVLFSESTTLGIRCWEFEKYTLEREFRKISTPLGEVTVKISVHNGKVSGAKPEMDECAEIARKRSLPLKEVYRIIQSSIDEKITGR